MRKKRVLFIADGIALAHAVRTQQLAGYLDSSKYDIFLGISNEFSHFERLENVTYVSIDCLKVEEYKERLKDVSCKHVYDEQVIELCMKSDEEVICSVRPDIVVGDVRVSLGIVCRKLGIPYINIQNAYYSVNTLVNPEMPDINPIRYFPKKLIDNVFEKKFQDVNHNFVFAYNREAVKYGFKTMKDMNELYSNGDYNLLIDTPSLSPVSNQGENEYYIGPVLSFPRQTEPDWWGKIPKDRPIVYCSIGSTGAEDKVKKIVEVLKELPIYVIFVTAGKNYIKKIPQNFYCCNYITAVDAIEISDLVIFNGGSGTLYQALSKGKPVIALATLSDQFYASSELSKLGIGKVYRYREMNRHKLIDTIQYLIKDETIKDNCSRVKKEIDEYDSKKLFPDIFERIVENIDLKKEKYS